MIVLLLSFIVFLILGIPVGFCMFSSSLLYMIIYHIPVQMAAQRLAVGLDSFPLLAVPFFILAGSLMNSTGITKRIFSFAEHLVGHFTGGLGHANVLASVIFSGMSGAAIADVGGLGAIELKAMTDAGYDKDFTLAITGASSIIGPIVPPSIPAVIFAVTAGVSTGRLFAGGIVPGILMALVLSVMIFIVSHRKNYPIRPRARLDEILRSVKDAFLPLMTPVIVLGGIMFGIFTPTEAAIVAVFYALILGFVYRTMDLKAVSKVTVDTILITVNVFFIVASASLFGLILTISQAPQSLAASFATFVPNKYVALLIINGFLLIVGLFMEPTAALMVLVPILLPVTSSYGIDPIHFGIVMILNLMIGLATPPVGMILYVLSSVSSVPFERIARVIIPYVLVLFAVLLLITFFPPIVTFLPDLLFNR